MVRGGSISTTGPGHLGAEERQRERRGRAERKTAVEFTCTRAGAQRGAYTEALNWSPYSNSCCLFTYASGNQKKDG